MPTGLTEDMLEKCSKEELIDHIMRLQQKMPSSSISSSEKHRKRGSFDFSKYAARRIAIKFAYIGWQYHGLTAQEKDTVETVESQLFKALVAAKLILPEEEHGRRRCLMSRCGRTDKGVSSLGQVAALLVRSNLPKGYPGTYEWPTIEQVELIKNGDRECHQPCESILIPKDTKIPTELPYLTMLNRLLPSDIRIIAWAPVDAHFDARFACTHRLYHYFFPKANLDIERMNEAAKRLVGSHDFRNFCKIDPRNGPGTFIRTILEAQVVPMGQEYRENASAIQVSHSLSFQQQTTFYVFCVKGNAFLWHQVRCMMAVLFLIGHGLEPVTLIDDLLDMKKHPRGMGRPIYNMASEIPLVLAECGYANTQFEWNYEDTASISVSEGLRQSSNEPPLTRIIKSSPQDGVQQKNLQRIWEQFLEHQTKGMLLFKFLSHFTIERELSNLTHAIEVTYLKGTSMKNRSYWPIMKRHRCEATVLNDDQDGNSTKRKAADSPHSPPQEMPVAKKHHPQ